jgi:hypothetical protein
VRFVAYVCALSRLLRALPRGPRLAFDAVNLLELDVARFIEVTHGGGTPFGPYLPQVLGDGCLVVSQVLGNLHLGPSLDVQIGRFLTALKHGQLLAPAYRHYETSSLCELRRQLAKMRALD